MTRKYSPSSGAHEAREQSPGTSPPPIANAFGLTPIVLFLLLVLVSGAVSGDFTAMPTLVALMISVGYALLLNPLGAQLSVGDKVDIFCRSSGDRTIILLVMVFMLAGAFYALTIDIGARDATVNLGLRFVPDRLLLPGLFLICCVISFAMGTSMGTITALAPIGIGLAESIGISVPMALGIVIGGAMFGDNLSFISDTTIAATRTQRVEMIDKFRVNLLITLPAVAVTLTLLWRVDLPGEGNIQRPDFDLVLVLPYLAIIIAALCRLNVLAVLGVGILSAAVIGFINGTFTFWTLLASTQKGVSWMQNLAAIALVIGGLVGLMRAYGGLEWLLGVLTRSIGSTRQAEYRIAALASLLDVSVANNTVAIVTAGPVVREMNSAFGVDPRRSAGLLDIFSCGFQGLIPYGGQLLTTSALAGISPLSITPYCWYPMLILVSGLAAIWLGIPRLKLISDSSAPSVTPEAPR